MIKVNKARESVNISRTNRTINFEERVFVGEWRKFNKGNLGFDKTLTNLGYLLDPSDQRHPKLPSDRDFQVAETAIQWLGSSVGQWFLQECAREIEKGKEALYGGKRRKTK